MYEHVAYTFNPWDKILIPRLTGQAAVRARPRNYDKIAQIPMHDYIYLSSKVHKRMHAEKRKKEKKDEKNMHPARST